MVTPSSLFWESRRACEHQLRDLHRRLCLHRPDGVQIGPSVIENAAWPRGSETTLSLSVTVA